jgi:predicted acylesterase/phospholipase RssA
MDYCKNNKSDIRCSEIYNQVEKTHKFTFEQLQRLRQHNPCVFKNLCICAVDIHQHETIVFNNLYTPNVDIIKAVRASCAIPLLLKPIRITVNDQIRYFTDGGLLDYIPVEKFDKDDNNNYINKYQSETLVVIFSNNKYRNSCSAYRALFKNESNNSYNNINDNYYVTGWITRLLENSLPKLLVKATHNNDYSKARNHNLKIINKDYKNNTLIINNADLGSLDFDKATSNMEEISSLAFLDTIKFLSLRNWIIFDFEKYFQLYNGIINTLPYNYYINYIDYEDLLANYPSFGSMESKILTHCLKYMNDNNLENLKNSVYHCVSHYCHPNELSSFTVLTWMPASPDEKEQDSRWYYVCEKLNKLLL